MNRPLAIAAAVLAVGMAVGVAGLGAGGRLGQGSIAAPHDVALPRPLSIGGAPLHLVMFGTSLSSSQISSGQLWPDRLVDGLRVCLNRSVTFTRVARPGAGTRWGETQIDQVIAAQPDLVLLEFAINDADIRDGISLRDSQDRHDRMLTRLRTGLPDSAVMLMTMNPVQGMVRRVQRVRLGRYYGLYPGLAQTHGTGLADFHTRWRHAMAAPGWDRATLPDGLHPTAEAAAELIVPALRPLIAPTCTP